MSISGYVCCTQCMLHTSTWTEPKAVEKMTSFLCLGQRTTRGNPSRSRGSHNGLFGELLWLAATSRTTCTFCLGLSTLWALFRAIFIRDIWATASCQVLQACFYGSCMRAPLMRTCATASLASSHTFTRFYKLDFMAPVSNQRSVFPNVRPRTNAMKEKFG